jgi:hypothetical protein
MKKIQSYLERKNVNFLDMILFKANIYSKMAQVDYTFSRRLTSLDLLKIIKTLVNVNLILFLALK